MRWKQVAGASLGAMAVYVVVAACASNGVDPGRGGGSTTSDARALLDAIIDAVTDPVPDVRAAPLETYVEPCNKPYACGGSSCVYAEHQFAGKSVADLRTVVGMISVSANPPIPGYTHVNTVVYLRDGAAAVQCGLASSPTYNVTFYYQPP